MRLIIGNGKVANVIKSKSDLVLSHSNFEITDSYKKNYNKISKLVKSHNVETIINTAAKINLEWCEKNKQETFDVNTYGPVVLNNICQELNVKFVHISSGCIFDGGTSNKIFTENSIPNPACYYAESKYQADHLLMNSKDYINLLILRPRQLISSISNPTNMLTKFLSLPSQSEFITSENSITCLQDFKEMIDHLIEIDASGIYNCVNTGTISPYEIAIKLRLINPKATSYEDYISKLQVKRVNTILSNEKLIMSGYNPISCHEALKNCIENYKL